MDKCRYNNKIIYIFDFYDEDGKVSSEHVQLLKKAGSEGKLLCDYCGEKLRFNYGKVIRPYFSHVHDNGKGSCKVLRETVNQKKVKRIFYEKMLRDNLGIYGEINYRFKNGLYTDLYFEFKDGDKIAIDYIDDIHKLNRMEKSIFFNGQNIKYIKVVNARIELFKEIQGEARHGYLYSFVDYDYKNLIMLDDIKNEIILFEEKINSAKDNFFNEIFFQKYQLNEVSFKDIGKFKINNFIKVDEKDNKVPKRNKLKVIPKEKAKEDIEVIKENFQISMF